VTAQYIQTDFPYQQPSSPPPSPSTGGNQGDDVKPQPSPSPSPSPSGAGTDPGAEAGTLEWPEDAGGNAPAILVGIVGARAGDEDVSVPVVIRRNPGVLGMTLSLLYDGDALELTGASNGSAVDGVLNLTVPGKYVPQCRFMWDGQELKPGDVADGEILILRFRVAKDAEKKTYPITVFYNDGDIIDNDLAPVSVAVCGGGVRVVQ